MPNPFPGMDPYLEGDLWTTVHTDLCAEIARQLSPKLRPRYVALSTRRVVLAPPDESEGPAAQHFPDIGVPSSSSPSASSPAAVASAPLVLSADLPEPIPHVSVEIRDVAERRLVTCIEVLSPTNKRGPGLEEYVAKRLQILSGSAHLLEIDLLRRGVRFPTAEPFPAAPYFVFLSRAGQRRRVEVWPIALEQPLPVVPVPLLPGDADVPLDLQQALTTVYDIIGLRRPPRLQRPPSGPAHRLRSGLGRGATTKCWSASFLNPDGTARLATAPGARSRRPNWTCKAPCSPVDGLQPFVHS